MNESILSKTISFLRFPLIVGVVFIHSNMLVVNIQGTLVRYDRWPIVSFLMNLFSVVLADVCVPLFFFISGFLFFFKPDFTRSVYVAKLQKRVKTLLVPYLIWNFLGFIMLLILVHPIILPFFPLLKDYRVDIVSFLSSFWVTNLPIQMSGPANPINTPLWFVRDLMVLVLFSPIIWWFIKKIGLLFVILLGIVWFFTLGEYVGIPGLSHQSLFFFPLGAFFGIKHLNFVEISNKLSWIPYVYFVIAIVDALSTDIQQSYLIHHFSILLGMVAVVSLISSLMQKDKIQVNSFLSGASFFIYALHNLFLGKMTKIIIMGIRPDSPVVVLIIYFTMPLIAIMICLGCYKVVNRFSPVLCGILTGGR